VRHDAFGDIGIIFRELECLGAWELGCLNARELETPIFSGRAAPKNPFASYRRTVSPLAMGDTVILTEYDSNDSKISM
jgi:hypothetical protein